MERSCIEIRSVELKLFDGIIAVLLSVALGVVAAGSPGGAAIVATLACAMLGWAVIARCSFAWYSPINFAYFTIVILYALDAMYLVWYEASGFELSGKLFANSLNNSLEVLALNGLTVVAFVAGVYIVSGRRHAAKRGLVDLVDPDGPDIAPLSFNWMVGVWVASMGRIHRSHECWRDSMSLPD